MQYTELREITNLEYQIVIGGVVNAHVAVKSIYVRTGQGDNSMHTRSYTARAFWAAICAVLWVFSWVIAESIPVFNDVLGLAVSTVNAWNIILGADR